NFQPGEQAVVGTAVGLGGSPVAGASVSAIITNPDGFQTSVPLRDAVNNGTYVASYSNNTLAGYYHVTVNASGSVGGSLFYRSIQSDFFVDFSISASSPRAVTIGQFTVSIITVASVSGFGDAVSL